MKSHHIDMVIADEQQIFVEGLKALIRPLSDLKIVGEAKDSWQLFHTLDHLRPTLLLTDVQKDGRTDLSTIEQIRRKYPNLKILVMSMLKDERSVLKLVKMGINGHICKKSNLNDLLNAIRSVIKNDTFFDTCTTQVVMNGLNKRPQKCASTPLTNREKEITVLIAEGLNSNQIAHKLSLSHYTIETHRKNIFLKAGVSNVAKLVRYALKEQLIE